MWVIVLFAALLGTGIAADLKPVFPANAAKPIGPYTPGISSDGFVYVSGQGARDAAGNLPAGIEQQTKQCLANVGEILKAAGVTPEHVVWAQVFLSDMKQLDAVNKVYASFFPKNPPARSLVSVAKMPGETPVEIAVVAVRNLRQKKSVILGTPGEPVANAVQAGNRVFVSGVLGIDAKNTVPAQPQQQARELIKQMTAVLAKTGMELRHMAYAHVYVDRAMPMKVLGDVLTEVLPSETALTVIQTAGLPRGAHIEISGIASREARRQGDCTSIGDTIYCAGVAGTLEQALKRVQDNITISGATLNRVVVTNVFLDNIQHFAAMNKVYAGIFGKWLPTRVTLQPTTQAEELNLAPSTNSPPPNPDSPRAQITVIAVR